MPLGGNVYNVSAASGGLISSPMWRFSVETAPCLCPPSSRGDVSPSPDILYGCLRVPMFIASWLRESRSNKAPERSTKVFVAENCAIDLDAMDVSLKEAIAISVDRSLWREKINEIALRATLPTLG